MASLVRLTSRSKLLGLPLADRLSALTVACSLGHKLPRRALIDFLCRIILGDDVAHLQVCIRQRSSEYTSTEMACSYPDIASAGQSGAVPIGSEASVADFLRPGVGPATPKHQGSIADETRAAPRPAR